MLVHSRAELAGLRTDCASGARFTPSFAALLRETVEKLQDCQPGGALLLEGKASDSLLQDCSARGSGHTPGLPAENNPMRCSIGEERGVRRIALQRRITG